jgi:hypothetical protein
MGAGAEKHIRTPPTLSSHKGVGAFDYLRDFIGACHPACLLRKISTASFHVIPLSRTFTRAHPAKIPLEFRALVAAPF